MKGIKNPVGEKASYTARGGDHGRENKNNP